jgi:AraC-like DNA-binding protein
MPHAAHPTPIWSPLVYFWEGGWLGIGQASGIVAEHSHHAVQITIGLDGPVRFRAPDTPWRDYHVAAIQPNAPHLLDTMGRTGVTIFVEPESREGKWLRHSLRDPISAVEPERLAEHLPRLAGFRETRPGAEEARRIVTGVVHALCAGPPPLRKLDERVTRALAFIRSREAAPLGLEEVAKEVCLSPSRFAHLFSEEVGLPFRRYLLWRKVNRAMQAFGRGQTLSAAAHASGFADSAHLTRTWHQMFGLAPTAMMAAAEFYEIPAPFTLGG